MLALALVFAWHEERSEIVFRLTHELPERCETLGRVGWICSGSSHGEKSAEERRELERCTVTEYTEEGHARDTNT